MSTVRIPISDIAGNSLKKMPKEKQSAIRNRISSLLEQEINKSEQFDLNDFQEVMEMSNQDMILTFGEEYLRKNNWLPSEN